jgi:hypothetical protein
MPSGVNSERAAPEMKATGMKTMQMHSVATNAGTAICCAPSRMARTNGFFIAMLRCTFSISTVASSTRIPTASDRPPRVMRFKLSPMHASTMIETRIESGMDVITMSVLRQLPRKRRIMSAVRPAAMPASLTTPSTAPRT